MKFLSSKYFVLSMIYIFSTLDAGSTIVLVNQPEPLSPLTRKWLYQEAEKTDGFIFLKQVQENKEYYKILVSDHLAKLRTQVANPTKRMLYKKGIVGYSMVVTSFAMLALYGNELWTASQVSSQAMRKKALKDITLALFGLPLSAVGGLIIAQSHNYRNTLPMRIARDERILHLLEKLG
jgi:hypothetical protein